MLFERKSVPNASTRSFTLPDSVHTPKIGFAVFPAPHRILTIQ